MTKLIFDKETHRVIGGAIVGTNGGELLGEIGTAIEMGCDAEDIALTIHAHPTLHESVGWRRKCSKAASPTCQTPKRRKSNFFFQEKSISGSGSRFLYLMFRTMSLFINRYTSYIL